MEIKAQDIVIEPIEKLVEDPKNENVHSEKQIEALGKIIKINGFRAPLVVSKRSGFVIAGNGRLQAARLIGMTELPVIYQDFENEADELRHRLADNEISRYAELDKDKMLFNLKELDIDLESFDFGDVGLLDFDPVQLMMDDEDNLDEKPVKDPGEKQYILEAQFPNEMELQDYHDDLLSRGYMVKIK